MLSDVGVGVKSVTLSPAFFAHGASFRYHDLVNAGRSDERNARLRSERGAIAKSHGSRLSIALAFPNTYPVAMSTLGFHIVYGELNSDPRIVCERTFLPERPENWTSRSFRLTSLESDTPLADFDVVAFSIHFEMDYPNVLRILDLAGIPRLASDRTEAAPLIIAGGPCPTFNPEPLADFVDAFFIGDAEGSAAEIAEALIAARNRGEALSGLARIRGVYIPSLYQVSYSADGRISAVRSLPPAFERVTRRAALCITETPACSVVRTPHTEFGDSVLVEMMRGCGRLCRFCVAGYVNLPPRPRPVAPVSDAGRIGLVGPSLLDHPDALAICEGLVSTGTELSVSSLRAESLTPDLARLISAAGQKTLTIAPEAGTLRLRKVINKAATDDELLAVSRTVGEAGFSRLKLYFMVGLPTETGGDVVGIANLTARMAAESGIPVELSISAFVPKPQTPFQWAAMASERHLRARMALLRHEMRKLAGVKAEFESPRSALVQGVLARGDRRLSEYISAAADAGGNWPRLSPEMAAFYANRERPQDEVFPWDHIDTMVRKDRLLAEYRRALLGQTTAACDVGRCARCGVCAALSLRP